MVFWIVLFSTFGGSGFAGENLDQLNNTGSDFPTGNMVSITINAGLTDMDIRPLTDKEKELATILGKLRPLYTKLAQPKPGDWLYQTYEPGQTFSEYIQSEPVVPANDKKVIYIQPIGDFSRAQRNIVGLAAEFLGIFYNLKVKIKEALPLSIIPTKARRKHPQWGMDQVLTSYVLEDVLMPRMPDDAAMYIAFTAQDLWPGEGWNFVFGQASLDDRVGVWSIYRNGDPSKSPDEFRVCLLRTLKTAAHEGGHMFSMLHCIVYECGMCGSNSRVESDRRPLYFCPECMAKVWWATNAVPVKNLCLLEAFCRRQGLIAEADFYARSAVIIGGDK